MSCVYWCASGGSVFVTVWVSVYRLRKIGETMCIYMHIHIYTQGLQVDILPERRPKPPMWDLCKHESK